MFYKLFVLFAMLAVAFAVPNPKPEPQLLTYSAGLGYVYPGAAIPSVVSPYSAPLAYTGLPAGAVYLR